MFSANLLIFLFFKKYSTYVHRGYIKDEFEESKPFVKTEKNMDSKISVQRNKKSFKMVSTLKLVRNFILSCLTGVGIVTIEI